MGATATKNSNEAYDSSKSSIKYPRAAQTPQKKNSLFKKSVNNGKIIKNN